MISSIRRRSFLPPVLLEGPRLVLDARSAWSRGGGPRHVGLVGRLVVAVSVRGLIPSVALGQVGGQLLPPGELPLRLP